VEDSAGNGEYPPARVLVVERDDLFRWALGETARDIGFEVVAVGDGASVKKLIDDEVDGIAAVLVDDATWHVDAKTLAWLRWRFPGAACAVMTDDTSPKAVAALGRLGITRVFAKPFDLRLLRQYLLTVPGQTAPADDR
jgi:DNA-binding NtrC family response regulator